MSHFDVIVIGCGPAGERAAIHAAKAGRQVAVVERANVVGGTSVNWGTIPSKTLRQTALAVFSLTRKKLDGVRLQLAERITISDFMHRERQVVQRELELINESLDAYRIEVFHGHGRFVDPHTVELAGTAGGSRVRLTGDLVVIATGTRPNHPPDVPFDGVCVVDSDMLLSLPQLPRSLIVLGAGVIGVEYASIFAALGLQVTVVDTRPQLLPYMDHEIAGILERELRRLGVVMVHDDHYAQIERIPGDPPRVRCSTRRGNRLEADVLLYCVGRDGNTDDLQLERIGVEPTPRGLLEVDEHFRTRHPHVYAVGDVIGYPALASTSMEQGRQAIRHAFGLPGPRAATEMLPFAIYAIPEVSYIGETEETLVARGVPYVAGRGRYDMNPRGQILGDTGGLLKLLFAREDGALLGVHIVGDSASELIHVGQAFLRMGARAEEIAETLYNYPTLSDLYRHAAQKALAALRSARAQP